MIGSAPPHDPIDIFVANPSFFSWSTPKFILCAIGRWPLCSNVAACAHVIFNKWCMTDQNLMWYLQHQILRTGDVIKSFSLFLLHGTLIKEKWPVATCIVCSPRNYIGKGKNRKTHQRANLFKQSPFRKLKPFPFNPWTTTLVEKYRDHCRRDKIATLLLHCPHYFLMIASRNPHHRRKLETSMGFLWKALQIQCSKFQHKNCCFAKKKSLLLVREVHWAIKPFGKHN